MGTFWGFYPTNPLRYKWRANFQKINPLASKLLVLEPKQILDPELENQPISKFCYLKIGHFGVRRAVNIRLMHIQRYLFLL